MYFDEFNNFKVMPPYHDGRKLLSLKDLNKEKPEIYIDTTNRTAGKTTFYNGYLVDRFLQFGEKFCLLYRKKYELEIVERTFFDDIGKIFFSGLEMISESKANGAIDFLYLNQVGEKESNKKQCGYAISISGADEIKKMSHLLSDVVRILFDEFQLESRRYLKNELQSVISIHDSIARGAGQQTRYVPLILVGNLLDLYNPYYEAMGISMRLDIKTNYMRGNGWVLAQGFNAEAASKIKQTGFHKAFSSHDYTAVSEKKEYLFDETNNIRTDIPNRGSYVGTISSKNKKYGVRYIWECECFYVSKKSDPSWVTAIAATESDIAEDSIFIKRSKLREKLEKALHTNNLYYDSMESKKASLSLIYDKEI